MNNSPLSFIIRNLFWIVPLALILSLWDYTFPILFKIVLAFLIMIILNPIVNKIERLLHNRLLSIGIVFTLLVIGLIILIQSIWPIVYSEALAMSSLFSMDTFYNLIDKTDYLAKSILPVSLYNIVQNTLHSFDEAFSSLWQIVLNDVQSTISHAGLLVLAVGSLILSTIFVLVFAFFLLLDGQRFKKVFIRAIPNPYFEMTLKILDRISHQIGAYIRGQLLAAFSVGILSIIGLYLLQWITGIYIPYTIIIGCIAGASNLIPFIGPIMGMIPAIIIYLISAQQVGLSFLHVVFIVSTFGIVQLLDNIVVSPIIMSGSVGLHPMLVIILIMVGGTIAGPIGMLFVVPVVAIIKVVVEELMWGFKNYKYL